MLIRAKTTTVSWPCPPVAGAAGSAWGQAHAFLAWSESGKKTFAPFVGPEEHGDLGSSMPASELHLAARNDELDDAVKFMEDVQDKARYSTPSCSSYDGFSAHLA